MGLKGLKVGDKITVRGTIPHGMVRTIKKVNRRYATDSSDWKWAISTGNEWGGYSRLNARAWKAEDDAEIEQQKSNYRTAILRGEIRCAKFEYLSEQQALRIVEIINESYRTAGIKEIKVESQEGKQ